MRPLLESKYDEQARAMYLRYSHERVAKTVPLDNDAGEMVAVDLDVDGETIGIEIVGVDDESVALATSYANEHGLSLKGAHFRTSSGT